MCQANLRAVVVVFHVSLVDRKNLSGEIYRQIRKAILDERLRPKDRLPPSRELARTLSVSRATVTVAYERLSGEGFVVSLQGAGTFVSEWSARGLEAGGQRDDGALQPRPIWKSIPLPTVFDRPARFDFRTGLPDATLFPHRTWRRLVAGVLRSNEIASKGTYDHPAGHPDLRSAIARHIGLSRGIDATMDDITITNGTQQALDILARVLLAPGEQIAVEDPCYEAPRRAFEALGIRVVGVPVDCYGLIVDALPRGVRVVYVTPSHQYPLGVTMSLARRRALLAWADQNGAAVIEDDYDGEFRFEGRPLEPLQTLDASGRVIYVGSFSKTMLPTLRLGFLVTPPSLRMAVQTAKYVSDWHTSTLEQAALARLIDDGSFARHVRRVCGIYRERREMIANRITRDFADHLELIPSTMGLHVTAVARKVAVEQITDVWERAANVDVAFHRLAIFAVGETARPGIVLGYGAIPAADVDEGLRRLRVCFDG